MVPRPLAPAQALKSRTCADIFQPCHGRVGWVGGGGLTLLGSRTGFEN